MGGGDRGAGVKVRAYIAMGSNMGDRLFNLREAARLLQEKGLDIVVSGNLYETEPVGYENQDWFLNTVVEVETRLSPHNLLQLLQEVENELGRVREIRWGPRTIDLDVLIYGDIKMNNAELTIPHPRMEERAFVLFPLGDINNELVLSSGLKIKEVIAKFSENKKIFCIKDKLLVK